MGGFPSLGLDRKQYPETLTEPEINAIYSGVGWLSELAGEAARADQQDAVARYFVAWWKHYGPTLEQLSERLKVWDDEDAPHAKNARGALVGQTLRVCAFFSRLSRSVALLVSRL